MRVSHMLPLLLLCAVPSAAHEDHDYDIVEGDIQVPREGRSGKALSASPLTRQSQLFPLGKVRYYIETEAVDDDEATPMPADDARVLGAVADWEAKTCIRFTKCASAAGCARPYIKFIAGGGCSSPVGTYSTRVNKIILGSGCSTGTVIHEIGHSLGMLHEQSRKDRDEYVIVDLTAVQKGFEDNFDKMGSYGRDLGAYDYGSIMHYFGTAFSNGNGKTIIAPEPIGQRSSLSSGDVAAIQFMYNECSANYARPTCMPSIDTTQTHLIPHSKAWNMDFNVMYKSSKSVRVSYAGTTVPAGQIAYSRAAGTNLGNIGSTELTFTPSAAVAGKTFTLSTTFTGTDGPSTTCAVSVRVADDDRLCFGIGASDPNVCSGHGACVEDIMTPCQCDSGYAGPDCSGLVTCPADVVHPFDGEFTWSKYGKVMEDSSVFVSGGASMRVGEVGSSSRAQAWLDFDDSEAQTVSFHMSAMGGGTQQYPAMYLRRGSATCAIVQRYSSGQWRVGNRLITGSAPQANRFYAVRMEFDWEALTYRVLVDGEVVATTTMRGTCAGGLTRAIFFGNGWLDEFKLECPMLATSAPATNAPATGAPATDAPATDAPATNAPATGAPATNAPATDAPATNAPATGAPATGAPATDAPATNAPATNAPATGAPATGAPATDAPATDAPATDAPKTESPATSAPRTGAPATDAPATEAPATNSPNTRTNTPVSPETSAPTGAPATDAPTTNAPATNAPATNAPATDEPATDAPATNAPATDAPATDAPATDAPTTNAPATGAPATNAPATNAPATDAPATDAPATDAPTTNAPATDAPATNAPATDAPATDAPATDAPATNAPATDAPATDAPATNAPATDAPATSAPRTSVPRTAAPRTAAPRTNTPATDAPRTNSPPLPPPTGCTTPLSEWSNCRKNTNCCPSGTQCFKKGRYYAQCRKTCPATGWSCKVLGTSAQTPPPPPSCNGGMLSTWSNCLQRTACCPSGTQCFEQSRYYAQCRRSCPGGDWTCRVLG